MPSGRSPGTRNSWLPSRAEARLPTTTSWPRRPVGSSPHVPFRGTPGRPSGDESATALLERELAANTFDDGLNRELATDYHRFVLELGLVAAVEADAHGHALSEATWERLARMLDAGAAILDVSGRPPRQGDGDEGRALVVDDPDRDPWATVLGTGAALLEAADWWPVGRRRRPGCRSRCSRAVLAACRDHPYGHVDSRCRPGAPALAPGGRSRDLVPVRRRSPRVLVDRGARPRRCAVRGGAARRRRHPHRSRHLLLPRRAGVAGVVPLDGGPQHCRGRRCEPVRVRRSLPVDDPGQDADGDVRGRRAAGADLERRARRLPAAEHSDGPPPFGDAGLARTHPDGRRHASTLPQRFRCACRGTLAPTSRSTSMETQASLSWPVGPSSRRAKLVLPEVLAWTSHRAEVDPVEGWYSPRFGRRIAATSLVGRGRRFVLDPPCHLAGAAMRDQVTDLRSTTATLRRHSRLLVAAALVGLVARGSPTSSFGRPYSPARPWYFSPRPASPRTAVSTSPPRSASPAVPPFWRRGPRSRAGPPGPLGWRRWSRYQRRRISSSRSTPAPLDPSQAQSTSQAVADSYVAYVKETAKTVTSAAVADLTSRQQDLEAQITPLQDEISATTNANSKLDPDSVDGRREAQLMAGLRTEQADLSLQLDKVKDQIATSDPVGSSVSSRTRSSSLRLRPRARQLCGDC